MYSPPVPTGRYYLLLFLLWPFLALITALANYNKKESRNVVYFFLIYYGLTFFISDTGYVDAAGYAMKLKTNAALPFSDFFKIVGGLYSTETSVDIVEPLISFIISRFTSDPRILFAVYAAVFGYFYLKSIGLLYNRYRINSGLNAAIYLAFFTIILPITTINGFRMWTAAWIFFFGAYHVILYRDHRYLLIALASSIVHWSFLSANVILIIYFFAGNRNFIYLPLAIVSFIVPGILTPFFQAISLRLGGALQYRYENYSSEEYMLERQNVMGKAAWFLKSGETLVLYYLLLTLIILQFRYVFSKKEKPERNLYSFLLLFLAFVNFGKAIPSFGDRFLLVFFLFATLYIFLFYVKQPGNNINLLTMIGLIPMALYATILFRQGSESISAWIFLPGLGLPLILPGLSISEILFY